ncbi:hypothetical protein [Methanococcoides sp. FTZ1]|uniref:hypothetical protein n=1 Tax=Methanococcoides sp. FTZ1 TaxID=3439061 RepID=UPI003F856FB9
MPEDPDRSLNIEIFNIRGLHLEEASSGMEETGINQFFRLMAEKYLFPADSLRNLITE